MKRFWTWMVVAATLVSSQAMAATYEIDAAHSSVEFKIRHLIGKVTGRFNQFSGSLEYDASKPKAWKASATIDAKSVDTNNEKRDDHLRKEDFFFVEKFPTLEFVSTKVTDAKGQKAKLHGNLTLHGVTKPVVLDLEVGGTMVDPWGNDRASFTATTEINRKDFGMVYNKVLDAGGLMLGEEVTITLEIEAIKKK